MENLKKNQHLSKSIKAVVKNIQKKQENFEKDFEKKNISSKR